ncbi:hypothetical protein DL767_009911 [Monosporascus sp. MG133]|nr:hypothetical protein DL767_009911 [Monosporascus sp. MG133]
MWFSISIFVFIWLRLTVAYAAIARRADLKALLTSTRWSAKTIISFPGSESFTNATERWTVFDPPTYSAAISPSTEADLVKAVQLATSNGIPFLATGGRHGYTTTLGDLNEGLAIDLSLFNRLEIDKSAGTIKVGGGVRFRDIYDPVYTAGFEIQLGTASCPGMVGVTLGAGVGPWGGVHGLLIDALLSLRVVTAGGRVINVSKKSYPDLFWAFRGAGANFGIVVSATYKLQEQVNEGESLVADVIIPAEKNASYFELLQSYDGSLPENLSISSFITYNWTIDAPQITASWAYIGPEADGRIEFAPLLALEPIIGAIAVYPWNKVITSVAGGADAGLCLDGGTHNIYTLNARNLSAPTYEATFEKYSLFYKEYPEARGSSLQIAIFPNQAALSVPDSETAYAWRDTLAHVDIVFSWGSAERDLTEVTDVLGRELRGDFAATAGYPDLAVYVNSAHGDETLEQIYGARKLPRLAALKKAWDPENVFGFNNALPTRYP